MTHSLVKNYIHMVFATKGRENSLKEEDLPEMHSHMAKILQKIGCIPIKIGGISNHIHILSLVSKNISVSEMAKTVKASSSKWIKEKRADYSQFAWQNGYAAFSVSQSKVPATVDYIVHQKEHHLQKAFESELIEFLDAYELEYDERDLWADD